MIKKEKLEPLMYIVQPNIKKPEVTMQSTLLKKIANNSKQAVKSTWTKEEIYKRRRELANMTVHEKIDFFSSLPEHVYKNVCEIKTVEKTYKGIILSKENDVVQIRTFDQNEPLKIKSKSILDIKVLGN
ncbi:MAG: hypothetical protein C6W58_01270 [Bacillaceae bacterium]|uniref:Spore coat protein CotO n=2 Tax=Aeribacillus TaxID=1055323 RepID=A0A165Y7I2_9BACI|nr:MULTISPECIES: CotO family spore coat protein [Aeribacillus]REJ21156.1 MAG: hypothetical protein C6W58_01270 [Bacillaceae bacterium]ASS90551.1 hypothetical protein AP3564_10245 [Aeribacillus pallidus]KZN96804.1 hypothetical protein AZI98_06685 [Aeribacillus pallidus]MDR9796406.1 CotO family spore coat protein [Aeribacillus pallidus]MED0704060.1 CotO family spore coat protein [Aeribacillus composti]